MPVQTRPRKQPSRRQPVTMEVEMVENEAPRLNKLEFDENDEKIINATLKAFESGTLTPLIKEELRCTIQSRRLAEGKGEMKVEFKTPVRKKEMDDDERRRALKRRQQNREAAQRFRQKQKDTSDYLTAKIRKLERSANSLTEHMSRLREEKELLGQMLKDHMSVCSNPQHIIDNTPSSSSSTTTNTNTNHNNHHNNDSIVMYDDLDLDTDHVISHAQQLLLSQSSVDTALTDEFTPNTAASDTSSVFFPDDHHDLHHSHHTENFDNNSYESYTPPPPQSSDHFDSFTPPPTQSEHNNLIDTPTHDVNTNNSPSSPEHNIHYNYQNEKFSPQYSSSTTTTTSTSTTHFQNLDKLSMTNNSGHTLTTLSPATFINNNNTLSLADNNNEIIVYDGPLDACYEEIIIDFAEEDAEFLRNDGRTRGDSCSSVDTVSSMYSVSAAGSELTPISETPTDIVTVPQLNTSSYSGSINVVSDGGAMSAYSGIHNIIDASAFNAVPCGKRVAITDDFFLLDDDEGI